MLILVNAFHQRYIKRPVNPPSQLTLHTLEDAASDVSLPVRLGLQQQASSNLRRHVARGARRMLALLAGDIVCFFAMRAFMQFVRDGALLGQGLARFSQDVFARGILNGPQFGAALLIGLVVTGCYGPGERPWSARRLFLACALATAMPMWAALWTRGVQLALLQYATTTALVWLGFLAERRTVALLRRRIRRPEHEIARTLFVGTERACREAMASGSCAGSGEFRSAGFVDVETPPAAAALGQLKQFPALLHATGADTVVVCGDHGEARLRGLIDTTLAAGCRLLLFSRALETAGVSPTVVWRRGHALIEVTAPALKGRQLIVKRAVDLAGVVVGLVLAFPVMLLVAAIIKLDSPGPAIFGQERIGIGGRRFRVFKFRTMRHGASDAAHRELIRRLETEGSLPTAPRDANGPTVYKLVGDARVTRFGRWLRHTSLDELPQLFNVLRGEMSLVGPRPPLTYEFEHYAHWQLDRLQVKPGITGLWQVSGRSLLSYRQMHELDVEYVRRWSLGLDLMIMLRTIPVVMFNSGRAH